VRTGVRDVGMRAATDEPLDSFDSFTDSCSFHY
jgi:hypothetical protein